MMCVIQPGISSSDSWPSRGEIELGVCRRTRPVRAVYGCFSVCGFVQIGSRRGGRDLCISVCDGVYLVL